MTDKKISALPAASTPLVGTEVLPIVQSGSTSKVAVSDLTVGRVVSVGGLVSSGDGLFGSSSNSGGIGERVTVTGEGIVVQKTAGATRSLFGTFGTGDLQIGTFDNFALQFRINNVEQSRINTAGNYAPKTAGKGIDFSANSGAAGKTSTLLTWYEEGTWTPSSSTPNITISSAGGTAQYTRIGRLVTARCYITVSNSGAGITGIVLTGLPFNSVSFGFATMHYSSAGAVDTGNMYVNDSGTTADLGALVVPSGNRNVMLYFEYYTS